MRAPEAGRPARTGSPAVLVGATAAGLAVATASSLWQMTRKPLWIDEAISLGATNQLWDTVTGTSGTMATYYVLLDGWTAVFGTSRGALRSLSLVLCLVALLLLAVLARRLLGPREAAAAVVATAALPGVVRMAQDARAYALVTVLAVACWLLTARLVAAVPDDPARPLPRRAWGWALALVPLAAAGVLAQGLFVLQLGALALSVLAHPRRRALVPCLVPAAVGAGAVLGLLWAMGARDVADWIPALALDQARPFAATFVGNDGWAMAVLGALALAGAVVLARRRGGPPAERWAALAPLWWGLAPPLLLLALSTVRPSLLGRYVLPSLPALGILVAVGAVRAWSWGAARGAGREPGAAGRRVAPVVATVVVVGLLMATFGAARLSRTEGVHEEWDRAAALVAAQARPGDGLVFSFAGDNQAIKDTARAPFVAAWREVEAPVVPVALSPDRPLGQVRRFDDLTPPSELSRRMVAHPRVWVVQFSGFAASLRDLLAVEPAAGAFRRARTTTFARGVQVVLLVRT